MDSSVPSDWQISSLENCMEAIIDYRGKTPQKTTSGIPLITAKVIKGGSIKAIQEYISPDSYDDWMRRGLPKAGDVLMTTEAPLGEIAQLDSRKVALAQRLITLRGKHKILENNYLKFLMQSAFVQDQLLGRASGTTVLGIKQSELRKILLLLPPLAEQQAIAHILGTLDDKIELNRQMNQTLEQMAQAIFKSCFIDFDGHTDLVNSELGQIPQNWEVKRLGDFIEVKHGYAFKGVFFRTEPPGDILLTPGNFAIGGGFKADKFKYYLGPILDEYVLERGDLIITMTDLSKTGDTLGYPALVPLPINKKFLHNQRLGKVIFRPDSLINKIYLYYLLRANSYRYEVLASASGTSVKHTSPKKVLAFKFPCPPYKLLQKFEELVTPLQTLSEVNNQENSTLSGIRDTLLPKLISGQLRIPDAEKILEEIL
jgi:type I restriction enzyme S subunit